MSGARGAQEATRTEEEALVALLAAYEPVLYLCACGCGRRVASPQANCIICANTRT